MYYSKNKFDNLHINVGSGKEYSIKEITRILMKIIGFKGKIIYDKTKPDGTPRKILDNTLATQCGWTPKIKLKEGLHQICELVKNDF